MSFCHEKGVDEYPCGAHTAAPWMQFRGPSMFGEALGRGGGSCDEEGDDTSNDIHDRRVHLLVRCGGSGCL